MTSRRVKTKAGVDELEVRYRGLKKNHEWLCGSFALANLYQHRKRLARINLRMAPLGA
jgi:hypothetical protein